MEIILPNNTIELPSIWNTEKTFIEQSEGAKIYIQSIFDNIEPVVTLEGKRPILQIFTDIENNLELSVETLYRYSIDHKACFMIQSQNITLKEV